MEEVWSAIHNTHHNNKTIAAVTIFLVLIKVDMRSFGLSQPTWAASHLGCYLLCNNIQ